jgi:4-amino-4-deoxy-L-arabinose transferase-like glycosyltransferase
MAGLGDKQRGLNLIISRKIIINVIIIVLIAIILRGPTLYTSVINWDETAFALVAREILNGHMPYDAAFDHKLAASIAIFGDDPVSSRLLGLFCIIASALIILWMLTKIFDDHSLMPTIISIAYIFANGGYGGSATFSELLVNFYVLLWMLLICIAIIKKSNATAIAVGAVMAISFHTNYLTGVYILLLTIAIPASAFLAPKNNKKAELEGSIKLCSLALIGSLYHQL